MPIFTRGILKITGPVPKVPPVNGPDCPPLKRQDLLQLKAEGCLRTSLILRLEKPVDSTLVHAS